MNEEGEVHASCQFHDVCDTDYDETRYETPTDVPLQSWLRDHKRLEKSDAERSDPDPSDQEQPIEGEPSAKAVKADDSKVPVHLWNDRVVEKLQEEWDGTGKGFLMHLDLSKGAEDREKFDDFLDLLRGATLSYWKRKVKRDFEVWYEKEGRYDP